MFPHTEMHIPAAVISPAENFVTFMKVSFDGSRSTEPPSISGNKDAIELMTLPEAVLVAICPSFVSNTGKDSLRLAGKIPEVKFYILQQVRMCFLTQ